ncbi:MAG: hypothetical protein ACOYYU_14525 [Chloroflexota bacterium]
MPIVQLRVEREENNGSLGIGVVHPQFWRQLHCRPPAVQLLAKQSVEREENNLRQPGKELGKGQRGRSLTFLILKEDSTFSRITSF